VSAAEQRSRLLRGALCTRPRRGASSATSGAAQAEAVASLAGVNARELAAALDAEQSARPLELRAKLALLEAARRELISRSQWSKHGKRI
jgi:hypothetical protein